MCVRAQTLDFPGTGDSQELNWRMSHPRPALTPLPSGAFLVDRGTVEAGSLSQ